MKWMIYTKKCYFDDNKRLKSFLPFHHYHHQQENLGSNEMLLYVAVEPEDIEADRPPVASLRKKHSIGSQQQQQQQQKGTIPAAPRIAYSYQVIDTFLTFAVL